MTLNGTSEWDWSRHGVEETRRFFQGLGHYVLDIDLIENGGAPAIIGQVRRHITPDLQISRNGTTRWVEVKSKRSCAWYGKTQTMRHGIDLHHWYAYRQVEQETGIPGLLAIYQQRPGPTEEPDPYLLIAPFSELRGGQITEWTKDGVINTLIYWDVDRFQRHHLENGRVPNLRELNRIIRPFEQGRRMNDWRQPTLDGF